MAIKAISDKAIEKPSFKVGAEIFTEAVTLCNRAREMYNTDKTNPLAFGKYWCDRSDEASVQIYDNMVSFICTYAYLSG